MKYSFYIQREHIPIHIQGFVHAAKANESFHTQLEHIPIHILKFALEVKSAPKPEEHKRRIKTHSQTCGREVEPVLYRRKIE